AVAGLVRGGNRQLAAVGARAGDNVGEQVCLSLTEANSREFTVEHLQRLRADPAQDQVLVLVRAGVASRVLTHDLGKLAELPGADVTHRDGDRGGDEARLLLRAGVRPLPALKVGSGRLA